MIQRSSISDAFLDMLTDTVRNLPPFMQVAKVTYPVLKGDINTAPGFHDRLKDFTFSDNRTGHDWLDDRIRALFEEGAEYWKPLHRDGQYEYVVEALKGMTAGTMPRWNANRLIVTLFDSEKDLHKTRMPTPPCLVMVSLHPEKQDLSLVATFRAQYTDAKGYGNLYSLAMLLQRICEDTGFKPKHLYSVAQKAILKYNKGEARSFLEHMRRS